MRHKKKVIIGLLVVFIALIYWQISSFSFFEEKFDIDLNGLKKVSTVAFPDETKITDKYCFSWLEANVYARLEVPTECVEGLFPSDKFTISADNRCLTNNESSGKYSRWFRPDDISDFKSVHYRWANSEKASDYMDLTILYEITNKPVTVMYLKIIWE